MGSTESQASLRKIPAVDQMLSRPRLESWIRSTSRGFVVAEVQAALREIRSGILSGDESWTRITAPEALEEWLESRLSDRLRPRLTGVINATGVILHTNLGRAPLSARARQALADLSGQYTNLEYELETGARSHRDKLIEDTLREIVGCEAATVVNNNAAAVFLILNTLAAGREVIVSRGELIEIGGSFRIPDILARSSALLREVGTTNKTRVEDYADAITPETALLLRVHPSNFRIRGFTQRPELGELLELARRHQIPIVEDIGSGCLSDLSAYGIRDEPVAQKSIAAGVDLISFSGDKLLGGPQAGIIAGLRQWIEPIRKNPLMRAFRVEKLIYGALEATLSSYRIGREAEDIPVLRLIAMSREDLLRRSRRFAGRLRSVLPEGARIDVAEGVSVVGGGSCPDSELPTALVSIQSDRLPPHVIESRVRSNRPPVILRVEEDRALIDLRTVFPSQEADLREALSSSLSS